MTIFVSMPTLQTLKPYIDNAISELKKIDKVLRVYCDFSDKTLTFILIVSKELDEEEFEEARIAQTEVLAAFPDGEIRKFVINQYLVCGDNGHMEKIISGELFYESNEMKKRGEHGKAQAYKLINSEKAEMEN